MAANFGWTQSSEQFHLKILLDAGMLERVPGRQRDVHVTEFGKDTLEHADLSDTLEVGWQGIELL